MFRPSIIFIPLLTVILISAFLASLTLINFWLLLNIGPKSVYIITIFFSIVIFFVGSYFFMKISGLKKEKTGLANLLEQNEKRLKNSEMERSRISKILLNFDEGILVVDANKKVLFANPRAKKILGVKEKNIQGLPIADLVGSPDLKPLAPHFLAEDGVFKEKIEFKNFIIDLSVAPLIFGATEDSRLGKNIGKLIILRDITQEKSLEKTRTDFILLAAHQLKTSIASARWSIKMFFSGDFGKITKEQKDVMERLYKKNDALLSLIDDLLNATKIEDGARIYNKTLTDITDIIKSEIFYFQDKIKSKKIKVKFEKPLRALPKATMDKEKIKSVIQNLLDNALKYTNVGGNIKISLAGAGKEIKFQIEDSGIGIPKSQQSKIFDKFFRADNASKIDATGSGLGLFIAKKIIQDHGGKMWFKSEENNGSIFYFTLPIE